MKDYYIHVLERIGKVGFCYIPIYNNWIGKRSGDSSKIVTSAHEDQPVHFTLSKNGTKDDNILCTVECFGLESNPITINEEWLRENATDWRAALKNLISLCSTELEHINKEYEKAVSNYD